MQTSICKAEWCSGKSTNPSQEASRVGVDVREMWAELPTQIMTRVGEVDTLMSGSDFTGEATQT